MCNNNSKRMMALHGAQPALVEWEKEARILGTGVKFGEEVMTSTVRTSTPSPPAEC